MKFLKTSIVAALILLFAGTVSAQKIKVISGDISALKSETSVNTEFTYDDNMQVGKKTEKLMYQKKIGSECKRSRSWRYVGFGLGWRP